MFSRLTLPKLGNCTFRQINDEDLPFLKKLYHTTRQAEMNLVEWSAQQKYEFLDMQFKAQHQHYLKYYPGASFEIIERENLPVGRLYIDTRPDEIRIIDIALLPDYCGRGMGTKILKKILTIATKKNLSVRIHVENFNPAMRLYLRLGFKHIETNGVYYLMEYLPST